MTDITIAAAVVYVRNDANVIQRFSADDLGMESDENMDPAKIEAIVKTQVAVHNEQFTLIQDRYSAQAAEDANYGWYADDVRTTTRFDDPNDAAVDVFLHTEIVGDTITHKWEIYAGGPPTEEVASITAPLPAVAA